MIGLNEGQASLAGGRPNAISGGQNAFAGVVNPANALWVPDRFDVGAYWLHQKSHLNNQDNNPLFIPGKANFTYKTSNLYTFDAAIKKKFELKLGLYDWEGSVSLAFYTAPSLLKLRTKVPMPIAGTSPLRVLGRTDVISTIFALKCSSDQSVGISFDYFYLSHYRYGFQHTDNPVRSVSPGHVTNNGTDHSSGLGVSIGWRWNITPRLEFGAAWSNKCYCGQFRRYRGFEPFHAQNFNAQTFGAGIGYRFTEKLAGRIEALWINLGNTPQANDTVLSNGTLNPHKRGSNQSPSVGLRDATFLSAGMGYLFHPDFSMGVGFGYRIRAPRHSSNILVHTYMFQTVYNVLSVGANYKFNQHEFYMGYSYAFKNKVSGKMPTLLGGGRFTADKYNTLLSISYGYRY